MNTNYSRWKRMVYRYDLISGKVNHVAYQGPFWNTVTGRKEYSADAFYHRYSYDAENRITLVETSVDSILWEKEARYWYSLHGPLARTVIGDQMVQGIDYAYTLHGWLKGMNSTGLDPAYDMGEDGKPGGQNKNIARDVVGLHLNYYTGDYSGIKATPFTGTSGHLGTGYRPLYNGNISSMAVNIDAFNRFQSQVPYLYNYKYDQLNRLTRMDSYSGIDQSGVITGTLTATNLYKERVAYDANGNIMKYHRYFTDASVAMDSMTYKYLPNSNKLSWIKDNALSYMNGSYDIENQPVENYGYDEIGNLIKDSLENIGTNGIKWNVYGKIQEVKREAATALTSIKQESYTYDAAGNRIGKKTTRFGTASVQYTWYVRDASGNIMGIYSSSKDTTTTTTLKDFELKIEEMPIYGSNRVGMFRRQSWADSLISPSLYTGFYRGVKFYEVSNHLGNVLTTITDKKIAVPRVDTPGKASHYLADISSANDYYPFGMVSRKYLGGAAQAYRFGFNGQENDNVKGDANQQDYGMRIYDPRVGRFLSTDPLAKSYPMLTPYQFASNSPIAGIDLDGLEFYYAADGKFLGQRTNDAKGKPLPKEVMNDVRIAANVIASKEFTIYKGVKSLNIQHSEFVKFSAIAYGESSVGNGVENKEEVYAIANAMNNFKTLTGKNSKAFAATDGNDMFKAFNKASDEKRNGTFMQTVIAGSINALNGGKDYSNGGTHWAGNDIGSDAEKWAEGLKFTDTKHDLLKLGNNAVPGENYWLNKNKKPTTLRGKWDYKWESTAAYSGTTPQGGTSGTTFMKVSPEYKNATGNKGQ